MLKTKKKKFICNECSHSWNKLRWECPKCYSPDIDIVGENE